MRNSTLRAFFLTLLCCIAQLAMAQNVSIKGQIINEDNQPLASAIVRVFSDTIILARGASDGTGSFAIELKQAEGKNLTIVASSIGYDSNSMVIQDASSKIQLGKVVLSASSKSMGEAVVTGSRTKISYDKIVKIPSTKERDHSSNAMTLLDQMGIATLQVDVLNMSVSERGEDVPIYINNMVASREELSALHPDDIVRVEYILHPKRELSTIKKLVNIITRPKDHGGILMGNFIQREEINGDYTLTYKLYHKKNQFTWFYNGYYTDDKESSSQIAQFHNPTDNSTITRHDYLTNSPIKKHGNSAGFYYNYTADSLLSRVYFKFNAPRSPKVLSSGIRFLDGSSDVTTYDDTEYSSSNAYKLGWTLSKYCRKGNFFGLTLDGQYSRNDYFNTKRELEEGVQTFSWNNNAKEDYYSIKFNGTYDKSFGKNGNLTIYYFGYYNWTNDHYDFGNNNLAQSKLTAGEQILLAGYNWSYKDKLNISFMLGPNYFISKLKNGSKVENVVLRPSITLGYDLKNTSISFNVFSGCGSPVLSIMNNIEQEIDQLQSKRGNSALKTNRFWNFSLNGNTNIPKGALEWGVNYEPIFNATRYITLFERGRYIQTFVTDGAHHATTIFLGYNSNFSKVFKINLTSGWVFQKEESVNYPQKLSSPMLYGDVSYYLGKFTFRALASLHSRSITKDPNAYRTRTKSNIGMSVTYTVPRYSIGLYCNAFLNKRMEDREFTTGPLYTEHTYSYDSMEYKRRCFAVLYFTFNLRHGNKKHQFQQTDSSRDPINSGIMK